MLSHLIATGMLWSGVYHPLASATALNGGGTRSVSQCRYGAVSSHYTTCTLDSCTPDALTVFVDSGFFSYRCGASPSHCNGYSVAIGPEVSDRRREEKYFRVLLSGAGFSRSNRFALVLWVPSTLTRHSKRRLSASQLPSWPLPLQCLCSGQVEPGCSHCREM